MNIYPGQIITYDQQQLAMYQQQGLYNSFLGQIGSNYINCASNVGVNPFSNYYQPVCVNESPFQTQPIVYREPEVVQREQRLN